MSLCEQLYTEGPYWNIQATLVFGCVVQQAILDDHVFLLALFCQLAVPFILRIALGVDVYLLVECWIRLHTRYCIHP